MVNLRKHTMAIFAFLAVAIASVAQMPAAVPQFSADMKRSDPRGTEMNGKIYFGGKHIRFDMNSPRGEMIMITDADKKTSYMIMPAQKMYMEMNTQGMPNRRGPRMPDVKSYDPTNPCASREGYTCKKVGTETVNGRTCDKWEFTENSGNGKETVWIDQKLHFPVKTVSADGGTTEFTNIKEGAQDASLFEVPAGYQKMDMGGMMGRRPPQE